MHERLLHRSLEELVQAIGPLYQFKCYACNEQLLKLLHSKSASIEADYDHRDKTAPSEDDIE